MVESSADLTPVPEMYVMYKRRWIGMVSIWLLNISTGLVWLTFNAVPEISSNWFNTGWSDTNLSVVLYFVGSIVASTFSGYFFETFGIKRALMLGGIINIVGTWIRYGAAFIESTPDSNDSRLAVALTGQFIAATAQPFFLNCPPKYAAVWFSDSSRAIATTIGSLSNPIAAAVAMILIPAICQQENGDDMPFTLLVIAMFAIVAFLSTLITPNQPPTPPSPSASIALKQASDEPFWHSLRKTTAIKQFWLIFVAFSVYVGFFNTFSSLLNQFVKPYGYTDADGGIFGASLILSGVVGAAIAGIYVDKTKRYITVLRICTPLLAISYIALALIIRPNFLPGITAVCVVLGVSSFSLLPVALELGIECTYPIPPSSSTSTLWMGGQLFGVVFLLVADALRADYGDPPRNMQTALTAAAVLSVITSASAFLYNSPNRRLEAEKKALENSREAAGL